MTALAVALAITLSEPQLAVLLSGNTITVRVSAEKQATLSFHADGRVHASMPDGSTDEGSWSVTGSGYCISWVKGPKNSCTTVRWTPGKLELVDAKGAPRGAIVRIEPGV
jgi:hypothetical protein